MRKKSIEELQAELALESEALATLQIIYAEKVKQVRTNTALPPDIQARFLAEWETFYQQRVSSIFRKDYLNAAPAASVAPVVEQPAPMQMSAPAPAPMPTPAPSAPSGPVNRPSSGQMPVPVQPPIQTPLPTPSFQSSFQPPPPPPPPISKQPIAPQPMPEAPPASAEVLPTTTADAPQPNDDILGVNTDSWMNAAESLSYEQYNDGEPIASSLMDSDKAQAPDDSGAFVDDTDGIDGYAATSGLKGLTEFMDFDLKRKKS